MSDPSTGMRQRFRADGFALVPGLIGDAQRAELVAAADAVVMRVGQRPADFDTRYTVRGPCPDTWGVNNVFAPELYDDAFGRVFENHGIMALVKAVLGPRLRFWSAHLLWSPSRVDYALNWHRDNGEHDRYFPDGSSTHVQFNVCLFDEECFRVVPGSHRRPLTDPERRLVSEKRCDRLPGEITVRCRAGDVLFMNHHALHAASCPAGVTRRTLHMNVQAVDEPTGGQTSWQFMRRDGYLERMNPTVRELMTNTIAWDDAHPLSMAEAVRRRRMSRELKAHEASRRGSAED